MSNRPMPSFKHLEAAFPGKGEELRALLKGEKKTREYQSVRDLEARCYNPPGYTYRLMTALNEILEGFGVEVLWTRDGDGVYEYVNLGDTYTTTLVRKIDTGTVMIRCWGDLVENDSRFNY